MLEFLEWYVPLSRIDGVLKLELLIWLAAIVTAIWIPIRTLVLKRAWLPMRHLPSRTETDDPPDPVRHSSR